MASRREPSEIPCGPRGYAKCNDGQCKVQDFTHGQPAPRSSALAELDSGSRRVLAADEVAEKTQKQLLQAEADVADAMHGESKTLRQAVQEHKQANPLDPRLEGWKDFLEAWAEEMPKEPEE